MGAEKAVPLLGLHPLPGVVLRNPLRAMIRRMRSSLGASMPTIAPQVSPRPFSMRAMASMATALRPCSSAPAACRSISATDEAVGDGVQLGQGRRIAEYHPAQGLAVDTALPVQNGRAKPGGQLRPQGGAGLQQGVVHRIRVDDMGVQLRQGLERGGLPRPGGAVMPMRFMDGFASVVQYSISRSGFVMYL